MFMRLFDCYQSTMAKLEVGSRAPVARCVCCKKSFKPNPRLLSRQKTCGTAKCRLNHRAKYRRNYRKENPEAEAEYRKKQSDARDSGFWKVYRDAHPDSTERNRAHSRLRRSLRRAGLQRQLDILQLIDPIENLNTVVQFATSHRSLLQECLPKKCG